MILENMLIAGVPAAAYAAVVNRRHRFSVKEIAGRLGLALGEARWYLAALAASVPLAGLGALASAYTKGFKGSMIAPYAGMAPSLPLLGAALSYAVLATALPEEFLFRGLIAGALFRRFSFWTANALQALIFLLPHLLILLVAPSLWFLMPGIAVLALTLGWLRQRSGSIGPGVLAHAASNLGGVLAVMRWGRL